MPNQTQPDPNQSKQAGDVGVAPFSPQSDLPPPPPEFQNVIGNTSQDIPDAVTQVQPVAPAEESGSAAPPPPNFSSVTSLPKKKFGTGKIIATILGIFALVGGVALATYTVGQKQLFQQKASSNICSNDSRTAFVCKGLSVDSIAQSCWKGYTTPNDPSDDTSLKCESSGITGNDGNPLCGAVEVSTPGACGGGGGGGTTKTWPPNGAACHSTGGNAGTIGGCITYFCPNDCSGGCGENDPGVYWEYSDSCSDSLLGNYCGQIDTVDTNRSYCIPDNSSAYKDAKIQCGNGCVKPPARTNPTTPPQPTGTPVVTTPPTTASCSSVSTFDTDWNTLTSTDRSSLKAGDSIYFCVSGSASSGSFDMARFIINGVQQADTSTLKPGTTQSPASTTYCQSYTIPEKTTTFTVTGQVHHATLGWF